MKKRLLTLLSFIIIMIGLYGQNKFEHFRCEDTEDGSIIIVPKNESSYFRYEKTQYDYIIITPKNEVNTVIKKGQAALYQLDPSYKRPVHEDCRVKPFQELIDNGAFSSRRMRELSREDQTRISVYYDETGIVSYVYFYIPVGEKTLLTEKELCLISQKLKTVQYDLSQLAVYRSETGSKTVFYCKDYYSIPFKDLKY